MSEFHETPEGAENEGIQLSPNGECYTIYRITPMGFALYTHDFDMAVSMLKNGLTVKPMLKHHIRGWN